jgi:hypothetical protein
MATATKDETRELEICALYSGGETMQEIADRYEVSRERIRQILRRNGLGGHGQRTKIDPLKVLGLVAECRTVREIALRLGADHAAATRVLHCLAPTAVDEMAAYRHEALRNRLLAELRETASRLGRVPKKPDLDKHGPDQAHLQRVFGSMTRARELAGLKNYRAGHPHLSAAQQEAIRRLYVRGHRWAPGNARELAARFGVTINRISQLGREAALVG